MLTVLLVSAAALAAIYLLFGPTTSPPPEHPAVFVASPSDVERQESRARAWASDRLGIPLSGVSCDGLGTCTLAPKTGHPFRADCTQPTCSLVTCVK